MDHHYVEIDETTLHYVEAGKAGKQGTMVFLHGFPEYWGTWQAQLDYFATDYQVIAPDLPGYNLSDKPTKLSFYAVPNLIQFMAKFIQRVVPNKKVILVAHDWGGAIAWPLVAFFPHLFEKLIILNAAHPSTFTREMINNPVQRQKSDYIHELIAKDGVQKLTENNYRYLKDKIFGGMRAGTLSAAQRKTYEAVWSQVGAINGMLQYYRAMPQLAPSHNQQTEGAEQVISTADMKIPNIRITRPTLILWGEQDQAFVLQNIEGIEEYVPDVQIKRFSDTSHWLQHEQPHQVNTAIEGFVSPNTQ